MLPTNITYEHCTSQGQQNVQSQQMLWALVTARIFFTFNSSVQIYEFHIFIISFSSFPGILRTNLITRSQLVCQLNWYRRGQGSNPGKPDFFAVINATYASVNSSCAHAPPRLTPGHQHFFLSDGKFTLAAKCPAVWTKEEGKCPAPGIVRPQSTLQRFSFIAQYKYHFQHFYV